MALLMENQSSRTSSFSPTAVHNAFDQREGKLGKMLSSLSFALDYLFPIGVYLFILGAFSIVVFLFSTKCLIVNRSVSFSPLLPDEVLSLSLNDFRYSTNKKSKWSDINPMKPSLPPA
jgi:hypothetical protein